MAEPTVPEAGWVTEAQGLVLNAPEASHSRDRFDQTHVTGVHSAGGAVALVGLAIAVVVAGVLANVALGPWGLALAALLAAIGLVTSYRFMHRRSGVPIAVALTVTGLLGSRWSGVLDDPAARGTSRGLLVAAEP